MIYGLYQSAAGMMTQEYRENVIANNLANADTVGFKQDLAVFAERQPESTTNDGPSAPDLAGLSGGLWLGQTQTDFGQAPLTRTDNPLDVALDGPGFLVVEVNGKPQYTRDGRLARDTNGQLVSVTDGSPVLDPAGTPILMNPLGSDPWIDEDGRVFQDGALVGRLAVVDFADTRTLQHTGSGRYEAGDAEAVPSPARLESGHVEGSAVEPVKELVNMIESTRAYQLNAQMISLQDQSVSRLIGVIAR